MPVTDLRGHKVPTGTDFATRETLLELSRSINSIKTVATRGEADLYKADLAAAGLPPSPTQPAFVWRTDLQQLHAHIGGDWLPLTDPNILIINGAAYQHEGVFPSLPTYTLSDRNPVYYAKIYIPAPYKAPIGWGFEVRIVRSARFVSVTSGSPTNATLEINYAQLANNTNDSNLILGWRLVQIP